LLIALILMNKRSRLEAIATIEGEIIYMKDNWAS